MSTFEVEQPILDSPLAELLEHWQSEEAKAPRGVTTDAEPWPDVRARPEEEGEGQALCASLRLVLSEEADDEWVGRAGLAELAAFHEAEGGEPL